MSSKKERLKIYKQMLKDYLKSFVVSRTKLNTGYGFCHYIAKMERLQYITELHLKFSYPELYNRRPKKYYNEYFWYKSGKLTPRIFCLIKTIIVCKYGNK